MPYGVNVADFLLDLAQGEVEGGDFSRLTTTLGQHPHIPPQQQQTGSIEERGQYDKIQSAAVADGSLSGPSAVRALYSSYETFFQRHRDGYQATAAQQADLCLALEPPLTKRQKAAAAAAVAAGKDPVAAISAAGKRQSGSSGNFLNRSFQKAGTFLGLDTGSEQRSLGEGV